MARKQKNQTVVGEICLYGAQHCGYGYLAGPANNPAQFGDGEPSKARGQTDAFWLGMLDLRQAGFVGLVNVFAPGGELMATADNSGALPYIGQLRWGPAPVLVISAEAIQEAAAKQAATV